MTGFVRVTATDKKVWQCCCCYEQAEFVLEFVAELAPKTHSSTTIRLCMSHAGATLDMLGTAVGSCGAPRRVRARPGASR